MRILIADDHSVVRKGLRQILLEGFPNAEIEEVADAEAMVRKIMQSEFNVVISDLSMPGRSGLEALQQIKQINAKLPVLILSIHPEEQYALRVLKAGASGYLSKDMAPDELVNAVQRVMLGKNTSPIPLLKNWLLFWITIRPSRHTKIYLIVNSVF